MLYPFEMKRFVLGASLCSQHMSLRHDESHAKQTLTPPAAMPHLSATHFASVAPKSPSVQFHESTLYTREVHAFIHEIKPEALQRRHSRSRRHASNVFSRIGHPLIPCHSSSLLCVRSPSTNLLCSHYNLNMRVCALSFLCVRM